MNELGHLFAGVGVLLAAVVYGVDRLVLHRPTGLWREKDWGKVDSVSEIPEESPAFDVPGVGRIVADDPGFVIDLDEGF